MAISPGLLVSEFEEISTIAEDAAGGPMHFPLWLCVHWERQKHEVRNWVRPSRLSP